MVFSAFLHPPFTHLSSHPGSQPAIQPASHLPTLQSILPFIHPLLHPPRPPASSLPSVLPLSHPPHPLISLTVPGVTNFSSKGPGSEYFTYLNNLLLFVLGLWSLFVSLREGFLSLQRAGAALGAVLGLLPAVASVAERWAVGTRASAVAGPRFSFSVATEIFPDQGLNPCPLRWQADS